MELITNRQIQKIHALLPAAIKGDADAKAGLVVQFTGTEERVSTKELTAVEAEDMIYYLQTGKRANFAHYAAFVYKNRQHRQVLAIAHELGWQKWDKVKEKKLVDLEQLGKYIATRTAKKIPLRLMTKKDIDKLIFQLNKILKNDYKKAGADD